MHSQLENKARVLNSLLIAMICGIFMSLFFLFFNPMQWALSLGFLIAFMAGIFVYFFQNNKIIEKQTLPENMDPALLIYYGGGNHFLNREGVGGRLFLFETELVFKSHKFNLQNHELTIPLNDIDKVELFNVAGFVPNGLLIRLKSGKMESFVVNNRLVWKSMIEKTLASENSLNLHLPGLIH